MILYQMLYGKKPFGHGLSPEKVIAQQAINKTLMVEFPDKPAVAAVTKEFIKRCLAPRPEDRPDVLSIFQEPYLVRSPFVPSCCVPKCAHSVGVLSCRSSRGPCPRLRLAVARPAEPERAVAAAAEARPAREGKVQVQQFGVEMLKSQTPFLVKPLRHHSTVH